MTKRENGFYTVRGYALLLQDRGSLTPSMEDYLEMAYRLSKDKGYTRIGDLAASLNVQPPSASKMVQKLAEYGYLNYERYGIIELAVKGLEIGEYLLKRHETIEQFLKIIGVANGLLEETEKIEHHLKKETIERIRVLVEFICENEHWNEAFKAHLEKMERNW